MYFTLKDLVLSTVKGRSIDYLNDYIKGIVDSKNITSTL